MPSQEYAHETVQQLCQVRISNLS